MNKEALEALERIETHLSKIDLSRTQLIEFDIIRKALTTDRTLEIVKEYRKDFDGLSHNIETVLDQIIKESEATK